MEVCTSSSSTIITRLPSTSSINRHGYLAVHGISLPLAKRCLCPSPIPYPYDNCETLLGTLMRCSRDFPGETVFEETSTGEGGGVNEFGDGAVEEINSTSEAQAEDEHQTQALEFFNDIKLVDSDKTYSILLYGSGAVVALYLTSAIVSSLESIPLFPKLMEVVGLGYTLWFTTRYLLFKRNRDELKTKVSEIKKQVLGSDCE
ncbi:PREDICTED: protein CURVATURE THYLAKOID 1D, chloroplastic-like [Camelina sativa]|uniref:Protein CURVATURE THYLAKOID 1D, chloroplastic-like n=1 Tax=Camelina sativa TaxID=90675 RepID=A0ABM1QI18_CAMSA|nr:PREDICTED: protein CURVATURE THYLAKOID 1D, chloroplastic-like [Camelina sativa]